MTSFPATMEVVMDWIWSALVLLMVTPSTFPSPDIGQDLRYLTQQMFILQPTHTSADLLPRYNICKLLSLILISFPVSETTIKNYLVTYPSSASNIMTIVHGLILHSASCTCLNQLPRAGDKCNAHRQCRTKFLLHICTSVGRRRRRSSSRQLPFFGCTLQMMPLNV